MVHYSLGESRWDHTFTLPIFTSNINKKTLQAPTCPAPRFPRGRFHFVGTPLDSVRTVLDCLLDARGKPTGSAGAGWPAHLGFGFSGSLGKRTHGQGGRSITVASVASPLKWGRSGTIPNSTPRHCRSEMQAPNAPGSASQVRERAEIQQVFVRLRPVSPVSSSTQVVSSGACGWDEVKILDVFVEVE